MTIVVGNVGFGCERGIGDTVWSQLWFCGSGGIVAGGIVVHFVTCSRMSRCDRCECFGLGRWLDLLWLD